MTQLNAEQRKAVDFHDGTLLLLAGPGSGKTTVLTHRIENLIRSGVKDTDILVITFTRAAALEMQDRFIRLIAPDDAHVSFGTFHAIFYSILKYHHAYRRVHPITDREKNNYIKRALEMNDAIDEFGDYEDRLRTLGLVSACKNNGNDPCSFAQEMYPPDMFAGIFNSYNGLLKDFDLIDFDDMINLCLDLLKRDEPFRAFWQSKFRYILIDEFQDISSNQYELVKLLAYPEFNIFAVGDDDQSIYAFRGANVGMMRRLLSDIPGAQQAELSVNYRSGQRIVKAAADIISANTDRFKKRIVAGGTGTGTVTLTPCRDRSAQNSEILTSIQKAVQAGIDPSEIAILVRTNRMGGEYAALLKTSGIECAYNDSRIPFSSGYMQDICAYMAVASGDSSRAAYLRIINRPLRYIKRDALGSETVDRGSLLAYYRNDPHMFARVNEMFMHLDRIRTMSPHLAIRYICNTIGYDRYVKEDASPRVYEEYREELDAFCSLIRNAHSYREIEDLLYVIRDSAREHRNDSADNSGVKIMTYHGSKGLEFDTVILPDVNENKTPSRSAKSPQEIEEERRMFYVAATRAKHTLHILYRTDDALKPSRFIKEPVHLFVKGSSYA